MSGIAVLHAIPVIVFARFVMGALAVFRDPAGARRSARGALIGVSFWAAMAATGRATLAPAPLSSSE
jgi:hypothetical protein